MKLVRFILNTKALIDDSKEAGLEVNTHKKTKFMLMSRTRMQGKT
jgi:hypothetical protein